MSGFVGIYPNANGQTNRLIAALDKIIKIAITVSLLRTALLGARAVLCVAAFPLHQPAPGAPTIADSQAYIDLFDERHPAVAVQVFKVAHNREYA